MKKIILLLSCLVVAVVVYAAETNIPVAFDTRNTILVKQGFTPEQAVIASFKQALRQKRSAYVQNAMAQATDEQQISVMEFCHTNIVSPQ